MPSRNDSLIVGWAEGRGKNLAKSKNRTESWGTLKRLLSKPFRTPERRREFDKMSKDEQDKLKAIDGWISGAQCKDGHRSLRNVLPRDVLTIDVDYAPDTILDDIQLGLTGVGRYEAFWHSSRRHTPEAPRVRLFMPMARKVSVDEYIAIVRFMAWKLDSSMQLVDVVSYRPAQMMFKPSCSTDDVKHYFTCEQQGHILDPDEELAQYSSIFGDWRDLSLLPKHPNENLRKRADKAEDPRQKAGPVGVFCRTFDIFQAMDHFLPGVYIPGDEHAGHPRFTYAGSTSSNGAIVYDDGLFLYSHHGHDPCCDMNVNAFDLVRIHLYGDKDVKAKEGATPTQMPSYVAMTEHLKTDKTYNETRVAEKFDLGGMFDDDAEDSDADDGRDPGNASEEAADPLGTVEPDEDGSASDFQDDLDDVVGTGPREKPDRKIKWKRSQTRTPKKGWFKDDVEFTENAEIKSTLYNVAVIIQNDKRLVNAIRYNEFNKNVCLCGSINPKTAVAPRIECVDALNGDAWEDYHDITIRAILESPNGEKLGYGMRPTKGDLYDGIVLAARATPYHPIRDYLLDCYDAWDGKPRIDTFLARYLDLEQNPYHLEVSRLMILASAVRIFEPGHKFDFSAILEGHTGIGKSWLIKAIYGDQWFGELSADLGEKQKVAEEITGKWGIELPELSAFHKADHNKAKAFMRRQYDDVRMAYDRRVTEFPRQCVCWGTTNESKYLKDPNGNRSYWPVVTKRLVYIDIEGAEAERDQLWGEAVSVYLQMREDQPHGTLPLYLIHPEARREALRLQNVARTEELHEIWASAIRDWLEQPLTLHQLKEEMGVKVSQDFEGEDENEILVVRTAFTREQAVQFALHKQHGVVSDHSSTQNIAKALDMLNGWIAPPGANSAGIKRTSVMHRQARWIYNVNAAPEDRLRGYQILTTDEDDFDVV